ncbi:MAG TPA: hypothetical protein VMH81_07715 [Bryobacteraceae bacterium]|nr:hypothetical protein [Bryobacteraceae bacterium]
MRRAFQLLGVAACALFLAIPMTAATKAPAKNPEKATQPAQSMQTAWPPETLSGKIVSVDPAQRLVIVQTADGVPFDMVINRSTRIESGSQKLTLDQLKSDTNRNVSVRFIPERSGDVARSIQLAG